MLLITVNTVSEIHCSIKYCNFHDFFPPLDIIFFLLNTTDETVVKNMSLNPVKSIGPSNISAKFLKLVMMFHLS